MTERILEKLFHAADNHGQDDDPDHTVGDLQDLIGTAPAPVMTIACENGHTRFSVVS